MDRKPVLTAAGAIALALVMLLTLPLVAGFFAGVHPAFDAAGHFRIHLAVLMIVCAIPLLAGAMRREGLMAITFGFAAIATAGGAGLGSGLGAVHAALAPRDEDRPVYRMLQMNLRFDNPEPEKFLSLVGRVRPDFITLNEVSEMWSERLRPLFSAYPHRVLCEIDNYAGGVAILSVRPFAIGEGRCLDGGTFATATLDIGGNRLEVGALHLHRPWPFSQFSQIEGLVEPLGALAETALVAGDINAAPWSAATTRIAEAGGLAPVGPSGPTWLYPRLPEWLRFAGLPIDQVFAKGRVSVHSVATLEAAGSDHLPVMVEFSFPAANPDPENEALTATAFNSLPAATHADQSPRVSASIKPST